MSFSYALNLNNGVMIEIYIEMFYSPKCKPTVIKQNELEVANNDLQIIYKEKEKSCLFSVVLQTLQLLVSMELTTRFSRDFEIKCC